MNERQIEFTLDLPPSIHRYQVLDAQTEADELLKHSVHNAIGASCAVTRGQTIPAPPSHHYEAASGNPYSLILGEAATPLLSAPKFIEEATRILRQYSPSVGKKRKLRSEFSAFIKAQSKKTSDIRAKIVEELLTYDFEAKGLSCPRFNRELSNDVLKRLDKFTNTKTEGSQA